MRSTATIEKWQLHKPFVISRGTATHVSLVVCAFERDGFRGNGESCPTPHYGEDPQGVLEAASDLLAALDDGADWDDLHDHTPPGAARNAVDCAVWDWRAKAAGTSVGSLIGLPALAPIETVFTIGLDNAAVMAANAAASDHRLLKLKLGRPGDSERVLRVRDAVPDKRLIVDANEAWTIEQLVKYLPVLRDCGVEMVEQPLPAGRDDALDGIERLVPIGADESCHVTADLDRLAPLYDFVNIKLDKTGGLTAALRLQRGAQELGLRQMVGCMLGTSLAMAPAFLIGQNCDWVDLDAPLLMGSDRAEALKFDRGMIQPPQPGLWG